jgi:hypothetical protein
MNYDHLILLTDTRGVFEHCSGRRPRIEHGYCVDDVARALIVAERGIDDDPDLDEVARVCSRFLDEARSEDGTLRNRCATSGEWTGRFETGDHWGRALWAWGTLTAESTDGHRRERAEESWSSAAAQRSPYLRSMSFAALGAGEVLRVDPYDALSLRLLADVAAMIDESESTNWPWPERRLTYANAVIPHALLLAGHHLDLPVLFERALLMLTWLFQLQQRGEHLSLIPAGGWCPGDLLPDFDQQPIEVAHLAEAARCAHELTGDPRWLDVLASCATWFLGDNDTGIPMGDARDGAGFDGLTWAGRNPNAGAESTVAYLSVMQRARDLDWG